VLAIVRRQEFDAPSIIAWASLYAAFLLFVSLA
jgi:hypothetical protein